MELVIGIDLATAEVRATAADAQGRVHAEGRAPLPLPSSPRPGWAEQDATVWWPAVVGALRRVTGRLGVDTTVVAVSVSATSGTVVALDRDRQPVGPALMYSDQRDRWQWLAHNSPGVGRLAHASDVVVGELVGHSPPTDWSHALKSGYDPELQQWTAADVPAELLPEVVRPTTAVGSVSEETAAATGLPPDCEVRLGMTDGCASQIAAGAAELGRFVSVLGTTLVLKGASRERITDPTGVVYSHRHPDGWWLPGGASNTGGSALRGYGNLAVLDDLARKHGPASCVMYPLNGRGERFPFLVADAEGFRIGHPEDGADGYRASLEGVAFVERLGYRRLAELGAYPSAPTSPVVASGKGSSSRAWNGIRATVLGVPLVEAPGATTALGACILAAAGSLHPDLAAASEAMAVSGEHVEPDEREHDALEASYERFVAALVERGWL